MSFTVKVSNISKSSTKEQMRQVFDQFGQICMDYIIIVWVKYINSP